MAYGWFNTVADADDYFDTQRLESEAWDDLDDSSPYFQKQRALVNAFNILRACPDWTLPTFAGASASQLTKLQPANAEMAYYLAIHLDDQDRRKGLQAQGVIEAGSVKEKYAEAELGTTPIPPHVRDLLTDFLTTPPAEFGIVDVGRDENEGVNYDPVDL